MKKRIYSIILALSMLLSMMNAPMVQAATAVDIGEDWAVWVEDDCSTRNHVGGMKSDCGTLNSTCGFIYQGGSGCGTSGDHGLKITTAIPGNFAITFDAFVNDIDKSPSITNAAYIRANAGTTVNIFDWNTAYKVSDETSLRPAEYATAKRKYGVTEVTDGTPTHMECKVVWKDGVMSTYYKWNTSDSWVQRGDNNKSYTVSDTARTVNIPTGTYAGIDNLKIYMPKENIPKTPMQESETWGIQSENDFSANTTGLVPYYSYYIGRNTTHNFLRNSHLASSTWKDTRNANHWLGMADGIKGDFAVDFDYFLDDVEVDSSGNSFLVSDIDYSNTFRMNVYGGALTKSGNYYNPSSTLYENSTIWSWTNGSLADDNGTKYTWSTALASSKYVSEPTDGTPSWLDMRVVLIGDTITTYAKWNTASEWKQVFTGAVTSTTDARGLIFRSGANVGIDNFKVLRPKENIVKTPTVATSATLLDGDVDNMIVNPHFGTPAFTEPSATVDIEFTNNTGVDFTKGTTDVYLGNEYKAWYVQSTTPVSGENNIYLGTKSGWKTTVTVPADISPELMNVEIIHTDEAGNKTTYFAPQAVQVTEELDQDFYSVAISDTHIARMGNENAGTKSARVVKYTNDSLAIANPRYLSHSGDIHDTAVADRKTHVKETLGYAFKDAKVPFIVVAGNHEYDTYTYPVGEFKLDGRTQVTYEEYAEGLAAAEDKTAYDNSVQVKNTFTEQTFDEFFGTKTAAIKMGEDMLIAKHDFGAWKWLTDEASGDERYNPVFIQLRDALATEWEKDEYDGDYRVVYQHCYNTGKRADSGSYSIDVYGTAAFMSPTCHAGYENMEPYDAQYTGHYHKTFVENDTVLTLGGGGKGSADWGGAGVISDFTYASTSTGKKWTNSTNDLLVNTEKGYNADNVDNIQDRFVINSNRALRAVYDEYYNENDGTAEFNIATITNAMDFNFYDGRVRFVMAPGKTYTIENGTKLAQYDSYDGKYTIVLAKVNIPAATEEANGVVNVTVKASDYAGSDLVLEGAETGYVGSDVTYLDLVSTAGTGFTASDIAVKNNGYDVEFTTSSQGVGITRIEFADALTPDSSYTVTVSEKEFAFTVLPDDGIIFLNNTQKMGSGYDATADGDSNYRMKIQTGTDENGKAVYTYANDYNYENYVLDYTVAMTSGISLKEGFEEASMRWYIYSADDTGTTKSKNTADYYFNQNTTRQSAFASSVLTNPLDIKAGYAYDFRVVKYNDTWKVYAKKETDDRYDLLLSLSGSANGIYSGTGRTSVYFCSRSANTMYYNYKLYPIENTVTVDEKVGQEFDVTFDVQPKDLSSVTIDGVGDVTFTKTGVKTYKATMPSTWTKKSADVTLSGITDIYSITAPDATLSAAEYEIDMRDVSITQNGTETDSVKAGAYTVKVTCDKNYTLPEDAKVICAAYAGGSLVSIKTIDATDMVYNGSEYTFDMTSEYDVSQIKLFAFAMNTLAPLAKSIQ